MIPIPRVRALPFVCVLLGFGCTPTEPAYRGPGLHEASLAPNEVASVYRTAVAGAFNVDDPTLVLLLDPVLLPRGAGLAGGDSMPMAVRSVLQRQRFVKGTCPIPVKDAPLVCRADRAGYVVRLSSPLAFGDGRDSVQVHLVAQQYGIPNGPFAERIRFERAYHVVRRGQTWRAVSEARQPKP